MKCEQVRELLSSYYDGELTESVRQQVSVHLEQCPNCLQELQSYQKLSALFDRTVVEQDVLSTSGDWRTINAALEEDAIPPVPSSPLRSQRNPLAWFIVAASLLLGISGVVWLTSTHSSHANESLDLNQFVADFQVDPGKAQTHLVANFDGRPVDSEEAAKELKRRPSFLDRVPTDFKLVSLNLLEMPCCTCSQAVYQTPSGRMVCIFEHEAGSNVRAGNCPMIKCHCCDRGVQLAEVGDVLLVTWPSKDSSITAVGLESVENVIQLVDSVEKIKPQS